MSRQWRYAIIGTGVVGELHIRSMAKVPNCHLVAVCDLESQKGRGALDKNKVTVPIYTDLAEMLRKEKLDSAHPRVVLRDTFRQCAIGAICVVVAEYALRLDLSRTFVTLFAVYAWVLLCLFRLNADDGKRYTLLMIDAPLDSAT